MYFVVPESAALQLYRAAPARFDGNTTSHLSNWLIPNEEWVELTEHTIGVLIEQMVEADNLGWMLLVWNGFRV